MTGQTKRPRLFLIDGHALCYRAFYAVQNLTNSRGEPTNAVFGFVNAVKKILKDFQPEYMAVCFDAKGKTKREEQFDQYKIHRSPMPDELRSQIPIIHDVVDAFGFSIFELTGYEADDILATIAKDSEENGIESVVVSDDKDLLQLVNDHVSVYRPRAEEMYDAVKVKEKMGVAPEFIADFLGLAGDSSDNIPGVKSVGKVTAAKLINAYGHVEDIYNNLDDIKKSKMKENLIADRDNAFLSRDLATVMSDAPIDWNLDDLKVQDPDHGRLHELFKNLEFRRLSMEFSPAVEKKQETQVEVISFIDEFGQQGELIDLAKKNKFVAIDYQDENVFLSSSNDKAFCGPIDQTRETVEQLIQNQNIKKVVFGGKSIQKNFMNSWQGDISDLQLMAYLVGEPQAHLNVKDILWKYLSVVIDDESKDSVVSHFENLEKELIRVLKERELFELFQNLEKPLMTVLARMENQGVKLDLDLLHDLSLSSEKHLDELQSKIFKIAGEEFNLNSPKQLAVILFEKLGLPPVKKTKTGYSTNEEVLNRLAFSHEVPALILEYRQYAKLKSTYIDALPQLVSDETGKIHAEFDQIGTETGRLSSRQPNLQNIPIRTSLGREIRASFIPSEKDWILMSADYSQIELRILAHLSNDESLIKAFNENLDIHNFTAAQVFDMEESDIGYQERDMAKRVNFGIVYGMGAFSLAKDLGVSIAEAQDFIDRYFLRYPKVKAFMDQCIEDCQTNGYVKTLLNRRRYIPDIQHKNRNIRQFAERQAINTPVQGTAADLIKKAMIDVQNRLDKEGLKARMLITVHDELVLELPKTEKESVVEVLKDAMEHSIELKVPAKINIKSGKNWKDLD